MIITEYGEIIPPFIRTAFNYDTNKASDEAGLACLDETRTQQQFGEECDINTIVERFGITGKLPVNLRVPLEVEFTEVFDYQTSLNKLIEADTAFMQMPANVRERFGHDAGAFVAFVSDPNNLDECRKMGLAAPERTQQGPIEVRVIPTPSEGEKTA